MKLYNGEKAIISLTSWKARINTVGLTIFSLIKRCPGFHIVLVLSTNEFPAKEAELPDTVRVLRKYYLHLKNISAYLLFLRMMIAYILVIMQKNYIVLIVGIIVLFVILKL